ncbi:uncharacterized protein LOC141587404 [Silene latifolia]|uniref:uncharacterized protein LOC141587404 n=1 Tax=Silene latifolia TaxID=37657 RepID=UPI003D76C893
MAIGEKSRVLCRHLESSDDDYGEFDLYMKVSSESDGFDVTPGGRKLCGGIGEISKTNTEAYERAIVAAKYAVDFHNANEKTDLVFDAIVKANGQLVSGFMYYITLRVHSRTQKRPKIYQAKVWRKIGNEFIVKIFRERPKRCQTPGSSLMIQNAEEKVAKPLLIRKGAFIRFMKDIRKLPELANMRYRDVSRLASKSWRGMTVQEKARYCNSRSLKYEDVEDYLSDISE